METVQIVLDKKLLQATDQAARRAKQNRSALVRRPARASSPAADSGEGGAGPPWIFQSITGARSIRGLGGRGGVAGRMVRGDVRLYRFASPDKARPVVVLTRDSAVSYLATVTVAPIRPRSGVYPPK
ncbi:MAG TPA: hypothetical protein VFK06_07250 [Candidatus Angelobacter sp.]|nr:hypothetical protein [Candidatus Angelobacter sp.]